MKSMVRLAANLGMVCVDGRLMSALHVGSEQTAEEDDQGTADAGGDAGEGHELQAFRSREHGHIARAAHVGHAQSSRERRLNEVKSD